MLKKLIILILRDNSKVIIQNIINKNPLEYINLNNEYDPLLIHFLEGLLEKNYLNRITALQALKHPWIVSHLFIYNS